GGGEPIRRALPLALRAGPGDGKQIPARLMGQPGHLPERVADCLPALPRGGVPSPHGAGRSPGGEPAAVRRERPAADPSLLFRKRTHGSALRSERHLAVVAEEARPGWLWLRLAFRLFRRLDRLRGVGRLLAGLGGLRRGFPDWLGLFYPRPLGRGWRAAK